jgi:hypothetical protein
MATHHHEVVEVTVPPNDALVVPNPVQRVPHAIIVEMVSGDARLVIPEPTILAESFIVQNPSLTQPNTSKLLVWHWHTRTR